VTLGRPNKGVGHIEALAGAQAEKERLRAILATLTGESSVEEACRGLGIGQARFQQLREQALQGALDALMPRKPGRPGDAAEAPVGEVERLRTEKEELEEELEAMRVRIQLALALPDWPRREPKKRGPERGGPSGR